jgi:hypothetical protein
MRKTLKPMTVFGSYNDLRRFFAWLAKDTGGDSLHHGVNPVQFSRLPSSGLRLAGPSLKQRQRGR